MLILVTKLSSLFGDILWVDIQYLSQPIRSVFIFPYWFSTLGDDLYGGSLEDGIKRQASHSLAILLSFLEESWS